LILYDLERSGNCYKIRLLLSVLELNYQRVKVDLNAGENRQPEFLAINPRGQIPVLVDDSVTLWDSTSILVYLARQYGRGLWLPTDPVTMAKVMQWLAFKQNEGRYGLGRARSISLNNTSVFARTGNLTDCQALGLAGLEVLEKQLTGEEWLVPEAGGPTIADIACYPYTAMAPEGGIDLAPFVAVQKWLRRVQALKGYVEMPTATPA